MTVDIYLPTYKPNPAHLKAAIDSILAQDFADWVLWINDQVTEVNTEEIISDYLNDERINFSKNEDNPGIGANWNDCLSRGSAPFVQYMFQDDTWQPNYLAAAVKALKENEDVGMASLGHEYIYEGEVPTQNIYEELKAFNSRHLTTGKKEGIELLLWWMEQGLYPNIIGEPSFVMLRRSVMEQVGKFREDMNQNLDSEYWTRVLTKTNWFYLPGHFGSFRVHADSASMLNYQAGRGMLDRLKMLKGVVRQLPNKAQPKAKKLVKKHFGKMVEKFIERYGNTHARIKETESPVWFAVKNWKCILKSIWQFLYSKQTNKS